jgi:hypothetical protein
MRGQIIHSCVCCGSNSNIVHSHVISNFIRKAITAIQTPGSEKFHFRWHGQSIPTQDLPKPKLMCNSCDEGFGNTIETPAAKLLLPNSELPSLTTVPDSRSTIQLREFPFEIGDQSFKAGEYQFIRDEDDCVMCKFSVLTAWRALHAMAREGNEGTLKFLATEDGKKVCNETLEFLKTTGPKSYLFFPYLAPLYLLGPNSAAAVTGANDEVPFAWAFIQFKEQSCVSVILGYWVIIWPLLPDMDPRRNYAELARGTFIDWHGEVMRQFRQMGQ